MTYEQALAFWFGRINYEQRSPRASDLKLDRMRALLQLLGDPQERLQILHMAGSKGKGSTSAMLAAILRQAGYRTGLFTSPHLSHVEERIQIDGTPIPPEELTALLEEVRPAVEALERHMASDPRRSARRFSKSPPPWASCTSSTGGWTWRWSRWAWEAVSTRPTSANRAWRSSPASASITCNNSVTAWRASPWKRPASSSRAVPPSAGPPRRRRGRSLKPFAASAGLLSSSSASISTTPTNRVPSLRPNAITWRVQIVTRQRTWPTMELKLLGEHQAANAAVAVACVEQLRAEGLAVNDPAVAAGLAGVCWPARLEVLRRAAARDPGLCPQ